MILPNSANVRHIHIVDNDTRWDSIARISSNLGIGLALSGGGSRAWAHIGVYDALNEFNICIDVFSGASAGSLVAVGLNLAQRLREAKTQLKNTGKAMGNKFHLFKDLTLSKMSLLSGNQFAVAINNLCKNKTLESLARPVGISAVDLDTLEVAAFNRGNAALLAHASMSLLGTLPPTTVGTRSFLDGGYANRNPENLLSAMGACFICSSDVGPPLPQKSHPFGFKSHHFEYILKRWNFFSWVSAKMNEIGSDESKRMIPWPRALKTDDPFVSIGSAVRPYGIKNIDGPYSKINVNPVLTIPTKYKPPSDPETRDYMEKKITAKEVNNHVLFGIDTARTLVYMKSGGIRFYPPVTNVGMGLFAEFDFFLNEGYNHAVRVLEAHSFKK